MNRAVFHAVSIPVKKRLFSVHISFGICCVDTSRSWGNLGNWQLGIVDQRLFCWYYSLAKQQIILNGRIMNMKNSQKRRCWWRYCASGKHVLAQAQEWTLPKRPCLIMSTSNSMHVTMSSVLEKGLLHFQFWCSSSTANLVSWLLSPVSIIFYHYNIYIYLLYIYYYIILYIKIYIYSSWVQTCSFVVLEFLCAGHSRALGRQLGSKRCLKGLCWEMPNIYSQFRCLQTSPKSQTRSTSRFTVVVKNG